MVVSQYRKGGTIQADGACSTGGGRSDARQGQTVEFPGNFCAITYKEEEFVLFAAVQRLFGGARRDYVGRHSGSQANPLQIE